MEKARKKAKTGTLILAVGLRNVKVGRSTGLNGPIFLAGAIQIEQ